MGFKLPSLVFNNNQNGPPDLDQLFAKAFKKFSGKKANLGPNAENDEFMPNFKLIFILLALLWFISGVYIVKPAERGVELMFGKYLQTVEPGPHWIPRIIVTKNIVNVEKIYNFSHKAQMLTKDENIVDVALSVQYKINDPQQFLFNVKDPEYSLMQAIASSVRQVVGHTSLDNILTDGRSLAREQMLVLVRDILANYKTGIQITDLNLQPIKPPEEVTSAFDDAIKAREDEQRYINKALAYKEKVVLIAQGIAQRYLEEARAYAKQVTLAADAGTASYLALLPEHKRAPKVTDFRLYTDALETVFSSTRKILLEGDSKAQVMVWPEKMDFTKSSSAAVAAVNNLDLLTSGDDNNQNVSINDYSHRHSYSSLVDSKERSDEQR